MTKSLKEWMTRVTNAFNCDLLYSGSFTSGTVNISKAISNYKKLIIVYSDNDGALHTKSVVTNNAANITTILDVLRLTGTNYNKSMIVSLGAGTMSSSYNRQQAGTAAPTQGTYITVQKVYGCTTIVGGYRIRYYRQSSVKGVA